MIQSVHNVLVGKNCPASYTNVDALAVGDVALFNEAGSVVTTAALAVSAKELKVGVVKSTVNVTLPNGTVATKNVVEFSNPIKTDHPVDYTYGTYVAPVQEVVTVTLTGATIVAGNTYSIRILYKDLYEDKGQFTHTYEVEATSTTAADLATALAAKINKHPNRRVQASVSSAVLTLTALAKDDNDGVDSINEYSIVSMEVSLSTVVPNSFLAIYPTAVPGAVIAKTVGNPGKGYWKQVRDAEMRNMGYKGHVFTGAYPVLEANKMVDPSKTYDYIIVGYDNDYLSNDNQYIKNTPLTLELFVEAGELATSLVKLGIESFIAGKDLTSAG